MRTRELESSIFDAADQIRLSRVGIFRRVQREPILWHLVLLVHAHAQPSNIAVFRLLHNPPTIPASACSYQDASTLPPLLDGHARFASLLAAQ